MQNVNQIRSSNKFIQGLRRLGLIAFSAITVSSFLNTAVAAEGAWKPDSIHVLIPHSVGGGQTLMTRMLGDVLSKKYEVGITYENKTGGSQRVGYDYFLRQEDAKECKMILSSSPANAYIMYLTQKPDWKWRDSIVPIGLMADVPGVWYVNTDSKIKSIKDLAEKAKKQKVSFGLSFWVSADALQVLQVNDQTGTQLEIVPTEGSGKTMAQVLGGHIEVGTAKLDRLKKAGDRIRVLAMTTAKNPVPGVTDNLVTLNDALGVRTLDNSATRALLAHKECAVNHPERLKVLRDMLEGAKSDPVFLAAATKDGLPAGTIPRGGVEALEKMVDDYDDAFGKYERLLNP